MVLKRGVEGSVTRVADAKVAADINRSTAESRAYTAMDMEKRKPRIEETEEIETTEEPMSNE